MKLLRIFLAFIIFPCYVNAQIAIALAKNENHSVLDYKVVWGYGYSSDNTVQAAAFLKLKGYTQNDIYDQTCLKECGHDIPEGYYVVVKSTFKEYKGVLRTGMGLGASDKSYEEATKRAVENLSIHNWNWEKTNGYEVVEKGTYDNAAKYQLIYIIWKKTTKACGIQTDTIRRMVGTWDNATIGKLEKGLQTSAKNANKPLPEVYHFEITKLKIGIIKERKYCEADKQYYDSYSVMQADSEEEINASVKPSEYQSQASEKSVVEILTTNDKNQSDFNSKRFIKILDDILGKDSKDLKKIKLTTIGIRG